MKKILRSLPLLPTAWLVLGLAAFGPGPVCAAGFNAGRHPSRAALATVLLTGYVFEDPAYGGGAGRPLGTSGVSARSGATVELYDAAGGFVATTTTDPSGQYSFSVNSTTAYQVRVVNATVTSSRPGYTASLRPVQTYAGLAGDANAANRVGGAAPQLMDANANTGGAPLATLTTATTTAESVAAVTTGGGDTAGPSFGYCFDLVVNTNDSGQGSLRQFMSNANALGGEGSLAQSGFTRSTTSATNDALLAGRETSIFMLPDGSAHPGLLASAAGGPANALTLQNGQRVAVITLTVASGGLAIVGANAALTTIDGGTQTANIGNTNAAVLGTGGSVGTTASLSYTSFSGPEVELLGEYVATNTADNRKPRNAVNVLADDFTLRNVAARNFGNPGGQGAVGFDNVPGRTGVLAGYTSASDPTNHTDVQGPVRALLENNVFGSDASAFAAPSPFVSNEGDNGRDNQHIQYDVSGTSLTVKTLLVRTNLLGFSERRGLHVQGNAAITSGYNLNLSIYDNVFQDAGVSGSPFSSSSPYADSRAGSVELIMTTTPFIEVYNNRMSGPGTVSSYGGLGSDGIEINNATIVIPNASPAQAAANFRRDAGAAQPGSRLAQNSISNHRLGILCQSNAEFSVYALDGLLFSGNSITGNYVGVGNQGASQQVQNDVVTGSVAQGFINSGPGVTFTGTLFGSNGSSGLVVGDAALPVTDANRPAVTGVVVGPGNVFSTNGAIGLSVVNTTTRATISRNSHYANGALGIDLAANGVTPNNGTLNPNFPNQELDYPILTTATLQGAQLTISGYVGSAAGQSLFAGATVEFFKADNNPANQNGELVAGDGQSVAHGEGRTYLGALTADGSGNFSGTFTVSGLAGGDFVTATATLGSGAQTSTSEFGNNVLVREVPLPVQLAAFSAQAGPGHTALVSWRTSSELNSAYFSVERSFDGAAFASIGRVAAQGNKTTSTSYTFTDGSLGGQPLAYYRLRQVDVDGTAVFSPVRSVAFGMALNLYPNPATLATTLDLTALPAAASYQLRLFDGLGRQVRQAAMPGGQATRLDLQDLPAGIYQVLLTDGSALRQVFRLSKE